PKKPGDGEGLDTFGGSDPNVRELEVRLADTLGAKVAIEHSGKSGKGRVVVAYNSLDELDGILDHIR
ncbi:MAG: chromosome partitioning protein ParB, partial [Gammaproteobacteria bacterium]|nr:chromosome partitioning protein ParB [Gammaproteobacteria bacterium]